MYATTEFLATGCVDPARMQLREETRAIVARHWAAMQGCDPTAFERDGCVVTAGSREVSLITHDDAVAVSAPADLADRVRSNLDALLNLSEGDEERAADLLDADVAVVLGPQFLGYADAGTFSPVDRPARALDEDDTDAFAALRAACTDDEWQRGGMEPVRPGEDPVFGSFVDDALAAVAAWNAVRSDIAGLGVVAHPAHRGEGHAKAAVSRATRDALDSGFPVVEYRTLERWPASVGLATDLGFVRWGQSRLVKLEESG